MIKKAGTIKIFTILFVIGLFVSGQAFAWTTRPMSFEGSSVGALAQGGNGFDGAGSSTLYSNVRANGGSMSAVMNWVKGNEGWLTTMGHIDFPASVGNGGEVWIRGYFYFGPTWSWASNSGTYSNIKILRAISDAGGMNSIISDSNGAILLSDESAGIMPMGSQGLDIGRWQCLELYVKASSTSSGTARIWKDGVLVAEFTGYNTLAGSGNVLTGVQLMGVWNNGVGNNQTQYLDNFLVTTDTPSQRDSHGNPMIGPINGTSNATLPNPTGLRVTAS